MEVKCLSYVIPVYFVLTGFYVGCWWDSGSALAVICWLGPISRGRRRGKSEKKNMLGVYTVPGKERTYLPEQKALHAGVF